MKLNRGQDEAIKHGDGPCMVLAPPGSGKTLIVTERTRCLIEERGVRPDQILVITFTRYAAREMKERFERLIDQMKQAQGITEQLKADNAWEWVGRMNNIQACAREIVEREIIYQ